MYRLIIIGFSLAAITIVVYSQVIGFDFINLDDQPYITDNPHVRAGLTAQGISWALSAVYLNWPVKKGDRS